MTGQVTPDILDLPPSDVPVFESGAAAAAHGLKDLENPSDEAKACQGKLMRRHPDLKHK